MTNEHRLTGYAGRLLSVNVGLPQDVPWQGQTVHTGVWKQPVDGPRQVRRLNIDGDGQGDLAGHGGEQRAVFVYQLDSYRYWQESWAATTSSTASSARTSPWSGLADDEVCIGDRYRIGAALFEVTQPRVTCYRVGIRMDDPRMPALLVPITGRGSTCGCSTRARSGPATRSSGRRRSGGDDRGGGRRAAVPAGASRDGCAALRIPALSPGWKASFRAHADQAEAPARRGQRRADRGEPAAGVAGFRRCAVDRGRARRATR